eukprot:11807454-Karenia_brevis.AAC.1
MSSGVTAQSSEVQECCNDMTQALDEVFEQHNFEQNHSKAYTIVNIVDEGKKKVLRELQSANIGLCGHSRYLGLQKKADGSYNAEIKSR